MFGRSTSTTAEAAMKDGPLKIEESDDSSSGEERSSNQDASSTNGDTTTNGDEKSASSNSSGDKFTKQETKAVNRSKILVYVALALAATAVGVLTWHFTTQDETNSFLVDVSMGHLSLALFFWVF